MDFGKYNLSENDWDNMSVVDLKLKAQITMSLLSVLYNTLSSYISPEEVELIGDTESKLLEYIDRILIRCVKS